MRLTSIQFIIPHIVEDHDHDMSFNLQVAVGDGGRFQHTRMNRLEKNNTFFVAYTGDPVIRYNFQSLETDEAKRIQQLPSTIANNISVTDKTVTIATNFNIASNKLLNHNDEWVTSEADYTITSNKKETVLAKIAVDPENATIVGAKYATISNSSIKCSSTNKLVIVSHGPVKVNDELHQNCNLVDVQGPVTLSTTDKARVFVIEYTE